MQTFTAKVPVRATLWLELTADSAYNAEAEVMLAAAKLEGQTFELGEGQYLKFEESPHGRATLVGQEPVVEVDDDAD